jgi:predicted nuclease of restriction endonuclease-like (RecB) superfamily
MVKRKVGEIIKPSRLIPAGYGAFLEELKNRIRAAQIKASVVVNLEMIRLYWDIGKGIVERQQKEKWGNAVVEKLAGDLRKEFPGTDGFSARNIWRMRAFYLAWNGAEVGNKARAEGESEFLPQVVAEIPWGHNMVLIEKIKDGKERVWYAEQTVTNGWSRALLEHWIESDLYTRQGKAITNFKNALPKPQSDLAEQIIKDPYKFEFLTLRREAEEKELEEGLLEHIRKFLIELGAGFAFVGQQYKITVDNEDFYLDLLFYHLKLRCFVVLELKAQKFKPEFAGKMNFYLSAVDDLLRQPGDKPTIGIILCKERNRIFAEYALRDLAKPIGIARYLTKLIEELPSQRRLKPGKKKKS